MLDMLDTLIPTAILDTMASVRLMLSLRPRLIPIFCMEVMAMDMLVTLAMLDTMDTPMLDMPTKIRGGAQPNSKARPLSHLINLSQTVGSGWLKKPLE